MSDRESSGRGPKRLGDPLPSSVVPESVRCPFCGGTDTELFSAFGSQLSVSQYWCRSCRTVFEWLKWRDEDTLA